MINLQKLANVAALPETPAKISLGSASVVDGILRIEVPLIGQEVNASGKSIPVAKFSGIKVQSPVSFRATPDGDLIEAGTLVLHLHGGASIYSRCSATRAALGLTELKGAK